MFLRLHSLRRSARAGRRRHDTLPKLILSEGAEQQKLDLIELADTGSTARPRRARPRGRDDSVFIYEAGRAHKVPVLLEDAKDADGKARAIRIDDGKLLKDDRRQNRFAVAPT